MFFPDLPLEIVVQILEFCPHKIKWILKGVSRVFYDAFEILPLIPLHHLFQQLYHGHLELTRTRPLTDDPFTAQYLYDALDSEYSQGYFKYQRHNPTDCGRYAIMLTLEPSQKWSCGSFGRDELPRISRVVKGYLWRIYHHQHGHNWKKSFPEISQCMKHLPLDLFLLLLSNDSHDEEFHSAVFFGNLRVASEVWNSHHEEMADVTGSDLVSSALNENQGYAFQLFFHPLHEDKNKRLFQTSAKKCQSETPGNVILRLLQQDQISMTSPIRRLVCWYFSQSSPELSIYLMNRPDFDPGIWNNYPVRCLLKQENVNVETVLDLLQHHRVDTTAGDGVLLYTAVRENKIPLVKAMSNVVENLRGIQWILEKAVELNLVDCLVLLCNKEDVPPFLIFDILVYACKIGVYEAAKVLLQHPRQKPGINVTKPLWEAILSNSYEICGYLLSHPAMDPSADNNRALITAVRLGHHTIVRLLAQDSRVDLSAQENYSFHHIVAKVKDKELFYRRYTFRCHDGRQPLLELIYIDSKEGYQKYIELTSQPDIDELYAAYIDIGMVLLQDARVREKVQKDIDNGYDVFQGTVFENSFKIE